MEAKTKICSKCGKEKLFEEFYKKKNGSYGLCSQCKICHNKLIAKYRRENPEKINEKNRNYASKNPEKKKNWNTNYKRNNPENYKKSSIKYDKFCVNEINDTYVKHILKQLYGFSNKQMKENPELIKSYRMQIKVKRELKSKKDENTETC